MWRKDLLSFLGQSVPDTPFHPDWRESVQYYVYVGWPAVCPRTRCHPCPHTPVEPVQVRSLCPLPPDATSPPLFGRQTKGETKRDRPTGTCLSSELSRSRVEGVSSSPWLWNTIRKRISTESSQTPYPSMRPLQYTISVWDPEVYSSLLSSSCLHLQVKPTGEWVND